MPKKPGKPALKPAPRAKTRRARSAALLIGLPMLGVVAARGQDRDQARSMVISRDGIVAAESPLAAQAGATLLSHGGNAIDAAVAANAVMGVVAPMSDGIGGDLFAIVYEAKTGKLYGLNASGWAPSGRTAEATPQEGQLADARLWHRVRDRSRRGGRLAEASRPLWQQETSRSSRPGDPRCRAGFSSHQNGWPRFGAIPIRSSSATTPARRTLLAERPRSRRGRSVSQSRPGRFTAADCKRWARCLLQGGDSAAHPGHVVTPRRPLH